MRARKRKKAKDKPETRRVVCVRVGRDMLRDEKDGEQAVRTTLFLFIFSNTPRIHSGHVTHIVTISHDSVTPRGTCY